MPFGTVRPNSVAPSAGLVVQGSLRAAWTALTEVTSQHLMAAAMGEGETDEEPAGRKKAAAVRGKAA
jgi:hypothetical protein